MKTVIKTIQRQTILSEHEAWWLIEHITKKSRIFLTINPYILSEEEEKELAQALIDITEHHKPLAYILGSTPFLNCTLDIYPPILIPRPETEEWVHHLISTLQKDNFTTGTILDIGTGSGCIAIALAQAFPQAQIYALDTSQKALQLAQTNSKKNNVTNITFLQSDLYTSLQKDFTCDLIVSNPPYIPPTAQLNESVINWEDHGALFAKHDGLELITKIIHQAPKFLQKTNLSYNLILEIDISHGLSLQKILSQTRHFIRKDQYDKDRTVWIKL